MTSQPAPWRIGLWLALAAGVLYFLYLVRGVLAPFICAFIVVAVLEPGYKKLIARGWKPGLATVSMLSIFFLPIIALLVWTLPVISDQLMGLKDRTTQMVSVFSQDEPLDNFFYRANPINRSEIAKRKDPIDSVLSNYSGTIEKIGLPTTKRALIAQYIDPRRDEITAGVQKFLTSAAQSLIGVVGQVFNWLFLPLIVAYTLPSMDRIRAELLRLVPPSLRSATADVGEDIGDVLSAYLRGLSIGVAGYALMMAIVLSVAGAPYALILAGVTALAYMAPIVGMFISFPAVFFATMASGRTDWLFIHASSPVAFAMIVTFVFLVAHVLFDNLVFPRLMGKAVGLHPVLSILVVLAAGALFGIVGMFVAFPVAGTIKVIFDRLINVTNRTEVSLQLPTVPLRHKEVTE